jgi:replicative DNA helicase
MRLKEEFEAYDWQAEYQLIGWVLSCKDVLNEVVYLEKEVFHYAFHGAIWEAIKKLNKAGKDINPFTLRPLLGEDDPDLEPIISYLGKSVAASVYMIRPTSAAKYLNDLYQKRKLNHALQSINAGDSLEGNISKINRAILDISAETEGDDFQDNLEIGDAILKDMANKKLPYSTGLRLLDKAMDGGLYEGKAYGFAARKKVGKTALAATISANLNNDGVKHLFICGEMSPVEIHQRVLARMAAIYPSAFRTDYGKSGDCEKKIMQALTKMPRKTLYKNAPGVSFDSLREICAIAVEKHAVKGIILDYWQLVGGKQKGQSDASHLDDVAQWLANFGRSHNVWTITMAQINQEDNTRGGEGIRLAFDQVYQLHRENLTESGAWLEMMETRYTQWLNVGSRDMPLLHMNEKGPFFEETA